RACLHGECARSGTRLCCSVDDAHLQAELAQPQREYQASRPGPDDQDLRIGHRAPPALAARSPVKIVVAAMRVTAARAASRPTPPCDLGLLCFRAPWPSIVPLAKHFAETAHGGLWI